MVYQFLPVTISFADKKQGKGNPPNTQTLTVQSVCGRFLELLRASSDMHFFRVLDDIYMTQIRPV
jgi:hypothetical protein